MCGVQCVLCLSVCWAGVPADIGRKEVCVRCSVCSVSSVCWTGVPADIGRREVCVCGVQCVRCPFVCWTGVPAGIGRREVCVCGVQCVWCPSVCWTGVPAGIGRKEVCVCVVFSVFGVLLSVGLAYQLALAGGRCVWCSVCFVSS